MSENKPQVMLWFKVYAATMGTIYPLLVLYGAVKVIPELYKHKDIAPLSQNWELNFTMCLVSLILGLVLSAAFWLPFFLKPRPWLWIYNIVLIVFGFTCCCTLPFSVWMLVFWLKPEVKKHYHRD